ncbi:MAG: O-methyltransferase [Deltaproteobacteria bacterium]
MDKGYGQGDPAIADYVERLFPPEDEQLREIRERSTREGLPEIQVGRLDGLLLELLARASGATRAVEIGTLGGYSGVCLLRGMGPAGRLDTFELVEKHAEVARESFRRAGLLGQVTLHVGPALERLGAVKGPFDLCFIDADKVSYPGYLRFALDALRVGGTLLADNTFAWGQIAQPAPDGGEGAGVRGLQRFNEELASLAKEGRLRASIVPTAEGLAMGVRLR